MSKKDLFAVFMEVLPREHVQGGRLGSLTSSRGCS